ncbi:MAG TPA: AbgT family transporter [Candidatus Polarisedimenticolia bacterium]|nr:AbgT family transporter [Candidatus Polarisedimenticolia bacterium]
MRSSPPRRSFLHRSLDVIEWVGNKLPHPGTLFALFALGVILGSAVLSGAGYVARHPSTGQPIEALSLLNGDGLRRIVTTMVTNFTSFVPLGTVLVAMLGVGVAEGSGLLTAVLRAMVLSAPRRLITMMVVFTGVCSNAASEAGYVILIPLAAVIFLAVGRHPLAGLAAAFAGVSGGYSANLVLGTVDPLLSGITQETARIIDSSYAVNPACNYYFMFASTFLITALGTWVTERIVEPRLGAYAGPEKTGPVEGLQPIERRGLAAAGLTLLLLAGLLLWAVVPSDGVLRDPETGDLLHSPFLSGIVTIIFVMFLLPGLVYGVVTGSIRSDGDLMAKMGAAMKSLGLYIVIVFFAAQFVAYFAWTNVGLITAIKGAEVLKSIGLTGIPLIVGFVLVTAAMNLFMGSASAKWAVMAPIFVPMFMLLGYTPELTQTAYRIGDSSTNVITPMMTYFALIVAFAERYAAKGGMGTIIALMLPYSITFLAGWSLFLIAWMTFGLPVGPGAGLYLPESSRP